MTSPVRLARTRTVVWAAAALLCWFALAGEMVGQSASAPVEPPHALVPPGILMQFMLKNSGNNNLVGKPDMPVTISVVLTNKSDESLAVFAVRFLNADDSDALAFPLGCMVRITDPKGNPLLPQTARPDGYWGLANTAEVDDTVLAEDPRNHFAIPPHERRAFSVPVAAVLAGGGTGPGWPVVDGKFIPGAYRFKFRWAGQESPEFSLTILPN